MNVVDVSALVHNTVHVRIARLLAEYGQWAYKARMQRSRSLKHVLNDHKEK